MVKRPRLLLIVIVLLCVAAAAAFPRVRQRIAIDSCLDAGGRWDYVAETCITAAAADR